MEPEKVEAWKALDGTLFLDYGRALAYNRLNYKENKLKSLFEEKEDEIIDYLKDRLKDPNYWNYRTPKDNHEYCIGFDSDGWDCDNKDNPVEKCVYEWSICDENCIYCGGPEERK